LEEVPLRVRQRLGPKERAYLAVKGLPTILRHARDFVIERLAPASPQNDGWQTPWHGHPVFVAQHATATCCRKCLKKWHFIPLGRPLTEQEIEYVVRVIERWFRQQQPPPV
jgi:hypothetical protein